VLGQRLLMTAFGAAVIVAIGLLGRKVAGERAGLLAAGLAALNANFWMNDVLVMSETLGTLAIALTLLAVYRYIDDPSVRRAAVVGALIGVAGLARAELLLLLPVTFLPVALARRNQPIPARLGRWLLAGLAGFAVLLPWTVYNLVRFEQPVLLSTNDGLTLVGANCDRVYGIDDPGGIGFWNLWCKSDADFFMPEGTTFADQSEQSAYYRRIGVDYIANHKRLLPKVVAIRVARGFGVFGPDQMVWLNQGEGRETWASWTGYATWWLLLVPAVAGGVVLWRRKVPVWPLASTVVVVLVTVAAFYGIVRFRLPADVAAVVLAAVALDALWRRVRPAVPATPDLASGPPAGPTGSAAVTSAGTAPAAP
jgi:4-amino-4-deoxy-L-arabinose transferase-like glycosyltransferase